MNRRRLRVGELNREAIYSTYMDASWKRGPVQKPDKIIDRDAPLGHEAVKRYLLVCERRFSDKVAWPTAEAIIMANVNELGYPIERTVLARIVGEAQMIASAKTEHDLCGEICGIIGCAERAVEMRDTRYGNVWLCRACLESDH
jgi:hypothetical protein